MRAFDPDVIKFRSVFGICGAAIVFSLLFLIERPGPASYIIAPLFIVGAVIGFRRYWKSV